MTKMTAASGNEINDWKSMKHLEHRNSEGLWMLNDIILDLVHTSGYGGALSPFRVVTGQGENSLRSEKSQGVLFLKKKQEKMENNLTLLT